MHKIKNCLVLALLIMYIDNAFAAPKVIKRTILVSGIGSFINERDVITSYSAIRRCKKIKVSVDDRFYDGVVLGSAKMFKGNLTFIRTNANKKDFALIRQKKLAVGDDVIITQLSEDLKSFHEIPAKIGFVGNDKHDLEISSPRVKKGNSGSPIYNEKGYMIGILKGISFSNQEEDFVSATSIKTIKDFANKSGVNLVKTNYYAKDLTKNPNFYRDFGVGIACFKSEDMNKKTFAASFGTGVFVNRDDVITNAHVLNDCDEIRVITKKKKYKGKLIAKLPAKQGDVAFIRTNANTSKYAIFEDRMPRKSEAVFFPYYTDQEGSFKAEGGLVKFVGNKNHGLELVAPGLERAIPGAPIYDNKGHYIGSLSGKLSYDQKTQLIIATPISVIKDFAIKNHVMLYSAAKKGLNLKNTNRVYRNSSARIICGQ